MNDTVIKATALSKKYEISHQRIDRGGTLRDVLGNGTRQLFRSVLDMARGRPLLPGDNQEDFWAIKNIDFEVRRGDVVGIIGRNGAGKSTLLKILSRITEPTEGEVEIHGRVASLLEVGTGFHAELTGRENIFLNGAILGMRQSEIRQKFDEIVAFAGVEKFLDTPVKRYSSGMYVRLAFSVAAHLDPEILIIDEVLAVGDSEFQSKCLGKMKDVAGQGRTVLFVSHNMNAVSTLCDKGLLLEGGAVACSDDIKAVIDRYALENNSTALAADLRSSSQRRGGKKPIFTSVSINGPDNGCIENCRKFQIDVSVDLTTLSPSEIEKSEVNIAICDTSGRRVMTLMSERHGVSLMKIASNQGQISAVLPSLPLAPGLYVIELRFWTLGEQWDEVSPALAFEVFWAANHSGATQWNEGLGCLYIQPRWDVQRVLMA